ncbi:DUF4956 domain-containing protein [Streptococcus dentapri]|uniref:DUF4956 domain-containing protein n=1 Tax=Streptococcus dentapri TaxID=573564 RepID=A0ABV8D1R1_9STRE
MTSTLFDSVFSNDTATTVNAGMLMLAILVSLGLGVCLSWVYKYRTLYTREFIVTLTFLPSLITLVIFLVNGNLGTSVAVAGTFSLIRFRSATSGSRELLAIFLSMIIGLASGMGFLVLATIFTILLLLLWFGLEHTKIIIDSQTRRLLTLTVEDQDDLEAKLVEVFKNLCTTYDLISITSNNQGAELKLVYEADLKSDVDDFQISQALLKAINNLDVSITKKAKKRKNL